MSRRKRREEKPARPVVFFIDRALGRHQIPEALAAAGAKVIVHDEVFARQAPDEEWLEAAGANGWVVITADKRISRNPLERLAAFQARVRVFVLARGDYSGEDCAEILTTHLRRITRFAEKNEPPFFAKVRRDGVSSWITREKLEEEFGPVARSAKAKKKS